MISSSDLWHDLQKATKPILIYGMGDGCDKILAVCKSKKIPVKGIFVSDEYKRDKTIHGFPLMTLSEARRHWPDPIALVAFGVFRKEMLDRIEALSREIELYVPDVPLFGEDLFDQAYYEKNKDKIEAVRAMLDEEKSQRVFDGWVNFKLTGKIDFIRPTESELRSDWKELIPYRKGDAFLDLGAYDGDTAQLWHDLHPDHGPILAVEPDRKNFEKLNRNTALLPHCETLCAAAWGCDGKLSFCGKSGRSAAVSPSGTASVRAVAPDGLKRHFDFIKMDVEGSEKEVIEGCRQMLTKELPSLCISAYHRSEDLFAIPLLVKKIQPRYRVLCRHTPYLPAWDSFFYFVSE